MTRLCILMPRIWANASHRATHEPSLKKSRPFGWVSAFALNRSRIALATKRLREAFRTALKAGSSEGRALGIDHLAWGFDSSPGAFICVAVAMFIGFALAVQL